MTRPIDRRAFLARSATTAAGVALAGTAGSIGDTTNGPGRNGISTAKPKRGGSLVFGVDAEEQGFNPASPLRRGRRHVRPHGVRPADHHQRRRELGPLPGRSRSSPTPSTPAGRSPSAPASSLPRRDTPCNGAALLTNFEAQKGLAAGPGIILKPTLVEITQTGPAGGDHRRSSQPWVPFPYYLAGGIGGQIAYVVAPSMLATTPTADVATRSAPAPSSSRSGWSTTTSPPPPTPTTGARAALPRQITFKPIPDENARAEALKSGTIDIMITDTPQIITQFRGNKSYSYIDDSGPTSSASRT
jgi:hypothetical protein